MKSVLSLIALTFVTAACGSAPSTARLAEGPTPDSSIIAGCTQRLNPPIDGVDNYQIDVRPHSLSIHGIASIVLVSTEIKKLQEIDWSSATDGDVRFFCTKPLTGSKSVSITVKKNFVIVQISSPAALYSPRIFKILAD